MTIYFLQKKIVLSFFLLLCSNYSFGQDGSIPGFPRLPYWQVQSKGKDVIILLHGGPGASHDYLRPEWDTLSAIGTVIYYDQRNTPRSERSDSCGWQEQVADLRRVIKYFSNNKKVILAGSSWGSILAVLYTYTFPGDVKAMILSGMVKWPVGDTIIAARSSSPRISMYDTSALQYICLDTPRYIAAKRSSPDVIARTLSFLAPGKCYVSSTEAYAKVVNSLYSIPSLSQLAAVKTKTLLVEGLGNCYPKEPFKRESLKDASRALYSILPNAQIVTVAEGCHDPWFIRRSQFFSYCFDFLRKL